MVAAALTVGWQPQVVFVREEVAEELGERLGLLAPGTAAAERPAVFGVSERVARHISTLETAPDVVAVLPLPERGAAALRRLAARSVGPGEPLADAGTRPRGSADIVVYLDGLQDPGNVGTLIRAAAAFGAAALVTSAGAADPYGPKAVRAAMGATFGLPVVAGVSLGDVAAVLSTAAVYGLVAHDGEVLGGAELRTPAILVIGAERAGISAAALAYVERRLTIALSTPASAGVESLNAGVAGAIALYELTRRPAGASADPSRRRPAAAQEG